jgi:DNA-binding Xre family transcriptional regulator
VSTRKQVRYQWRPPALMSLRGLSTAGQLRRLLVDEGINLSLSQVRRMIAAPPSRISLHLLAVLCQALNVDPGQLIDIRPVGSSKPRGATAMLNRPAPAISTRAPTAPRSRPSGRTPSSTPDRPYHITVA